MKSLISILTFALVCGCGDDGGSAIDAGPDAPAPPAYASTLLPNLTPADRTDLCRRFVDSLGGENVTVQCPSFTFEVGTYAECETAMAGVVGTCVATAGQALECGVATAASPCTFGDDSVACMNFHACFGGGGDATGHSWQQPHHRE